MSQPNMDSNFADMIINMIKNNVLLKPNDVITLIQKVNDILLEEPNLLVLKSPIVICGDIHGQLEDLLKLFEVAGGEELTYLFMGDYVDRGRFSVDTICYLLAWKLKTKRIYLLRGNHESREINAHYGFHAECEKLFFGGLIYDLFNRLFDSLPLAAIINNKVFSIHGGLSPELTKIEKINEIDRFNEIPNQGILSDITWSDPDETKSEWIASPRGQGYIFGEAQVDQFLSENPYIEFITRSHSLVQEGYYWYFNNNNNSNEKKQKLVNVWSAPNYEYRAGNKAAVLKYGFNGPDSIEFVVFTEEEPDKRRPQDQEEPALYFA